MALLPKGVSEDYSRLCDELKSHYGWREPPSTTRQKLADLQQGSRTLAEHAEEVQKLATRAYPDADPRTQDQYAAEAFARGLRNRRIAFLVLQRAPSTLSEAMTYADTCEHNYRAAMRDDKAKAWSRRVSWADDSDDGWGTEDEHGCMRRAATPPRSAAPRPSGKPAMPRTTPGKPLDPDTEGRISQLEAKYEKIESLLKELAASKHGYQDRSISPSSRRGARQQPPGQCYGCGEEGHFRRDCPRSRSQSPAQPMEKSGNE